MSTDHLPDQDRQAKLESLVRANASVVFGVCLAGTRNTHDAEDLAQETLLKAIKNIHELRDPEKIRPWLLQIARRLCINHGQRKRSTRPLPDYIPAPEQAPDHRLERLQAALAELPEEYREPICIFYLDGRSSAGVAQALGISESAARVRLHRARAMLHDILKECES